MIKKHGVIWNWTVKLVDTLWRWFEKAKPECEVDSKAWMFKDKTNAEIKNSDFFQLNSDHFHISQFWQFLYLAILTLFISHNSDNFLSRNLENFYISQFWQFSYLAI